MNPDPDGVPAHGDASDDVPATAAEAPVLEAWEVFRR